MTYLTALEVAEMLRVSQRTLYSYVAAKKLPAPIRIGGKRLWIEQAVYDRVGGHETMARGKRSK